MREAGNSDDGAAVRQVVSRLMTGALHDMQAAGRGSVGDRLAWSHFLLSSSVSHAAIAAYWRWTA